MAMSVTYGTFAGHVVYENRGGAESTYMRDPLGNTIGLLDMSGNRTDSWTYWPYGEVQNHTGSSKTTLTFLGTLGYFVDLLSLLYVRARHFRANLTVWSTLDPLWPRQAAYAYVDAAPNTQVDPSGLFAFIPVLCAAACALATGCLAAATVACQNWQSDGFGSWLDCAKEFMNSLPWWQRDSCLYFGYAGCIACIAVVLWPVVAPIITILAPRICYAACLFVCEEFLDLPTDQCLRLCSPFLVAGIPLIP